jgi:hypothetical protein
MAPSAVLRAAEPTRAPFPQEDGVSVLEFGAAGDGRQDDTPAFEAAFKAAAQSGGNVVRMPRGNSLIQGTLDVPENVVLEGYFRAPTARTQARGSTLLAVAGAGKADGKPFITLHQNSTLCGLTVTACDFMDRGKVQVALEPEVEAALIFGNRLRGKERISNQAGDRAQIGMNLVSG